MIVLKATTPETARDAILEFLRGEAERYFTTARTSKPRAADLDIARGNALKLAVVMLKDCAFVEKWKD